MGKQNEDYKAEYVDIHGKRHIVTAEEAFAVNGYNDPPGGYYCPYCKIPMVLCHRNNHWYFRTNPPRLDKRAQEDKDSNGHLDGCQYRQVICRRVVVERQYSKDTDNVNIAEIILKNEKTRQSSEAVSNIGESRAGIEKIKDSEEADVNYDSKIQPIKSCIDLYRAAYMRGFGRSKIKTSKNLNVPRELLINCILNANNYLSFRNGNLKLEGYKIAIARRVYAQDEIAVALRQKLNLPGSVWILSDPYIGERSSRVYYAFDTDENKDGGTNFRTVAGKKGSSKLFLIACLWELPANSNEGTLTVNVKGKDIPIRCSIGHIRGRNIEELPELSNDKNLEPAELINFSS